jgi:uncharacterized DUF497 family protein
MKFEWDANKAVSNLAKHGVSFEESSMIHFMLISTIQTIQMMKSAT